MKGVFMPKKVTPDDVGRQLGYAQEELRKAAGVKGLAVQEPFLQSARRYIEQASKMLARLESDDIKK